MKALFCGIYVIASDAKSVLLTLSRESTKHWHYNENIVNKATVNHSTDDRMIFCRLDIQYYLAIANDYIANI